MGDEGVEQICNLETHNICLLNIRKMTITRYKQYRLNWHSYTFDSQMGQTGRFVAVFQQSRKSGMQIPFKSLLNQPEISIIRFPFIKLDEN